MGRSHTLRVYRLQLSAHFGLAFATASCLRHLTSLQTSNSPDHYAKGTPSAACGASSALSLRPIVGAWFQVLFHSPPGVLFTFPSRYLSAIGHQGVFRLSGWSRQIHTEFHEFRDTRVSAQRSSRLTSTGLSPAPAPLSNGLQLHQEFLTPHQHGSTGQTNPTTPHTQPLPGITRAWFSLFRFRSPLLSESLLFSLPVGTEMFHFPTFPPHTLFHSGAGNWT